MGSKSKRARTPAKTQEELDNIAAQTRLANLQYDLAIENRALNQESYQFTKDVLLPNYYEQQGYDPVYDDDGNIIDLQRSTEGQRLDSLRDELNQAQLDGSKESILYQRTLREQIGKEEANRLKAGEVLEGYYSELSQFNEELDADFQDQISRIDGSLLGPLQTDLQIAEQELNDRLRDQLGSGYDQSSGGLEALARFERQKSAALNQARFQEVGLESDLTSKRSALALQTKGFGAQAELTKLGIAGNLQQALSGGQTSLAGSGINAYQVGSVNPQLGTLASTNNFGLGLADFNSAQNSYSSLSDYYQGDRRIQASINAQNAQRGGSGLSSLAGLTAGAFAGKFAGGAGTHLGTAAATKFLS